MPGNCYNTVKWVVYEMFLLVYERTAKNIYVSSMIPDSLLNSSYRVLSYVWLGTAE
jgi:hypothetical protein